MDPFADLMRHVHPLLPEKRLGRGPLRVTVGNRDFALFRDGSGRPGALVDRCPHRAAPLSRGRVMADGRLECAYHGWNFTVEGAGRSPTQPPLQRCDVKALRVERRYDYLWGVDPSSASAATAKFPLDTPDGFEFVGSFSQVLPAPLHVCLDNFSEDEHTPFVHTRLGWDRSQLHRVEFSSDNFDDRTEVHYRAPQRPSKVLSLFSIQAGDYFVNDWVTRFDPVRTDYQISWVSPRGERRPITNRSVIFMTPESATTTRFDVFAFMKLEDATLRRFARLIGWAGLALGWLEVRDDRKFVEHLAHTPISMDGMRLGKFDKPLIHNRKLLERVYYGRSSESRLSVIGGG